MQCQEIMERESKKIDMVERDAEMQEYNTIYNKV
jgi:hypothetical protein